MNSRAPLATAALLFVAGCATTKGASGPVEPGPAKPPPPAEPARTASPAEAAHDAFLEEARQIAALQASGKLDWGDVESRMAAVVAKHKRHAPAWYNLALAQERNGKGDDAENSYRQAIHLDPKLAAAQENLAALVLKKGDARQAMQLLRELVQRDAGSATARVALAESSLATGELERAEELAHEALARDPKNMDAYCVLARVAVGSKDFQRARLLVSQGLKIDRGPKSACLSYALGVVFLHEKETAKALAEFSRVVERDGGAILEARFHIANISMGFKDFKRAIDTYRSVTELDPGNVAALVNLGVAYKGSGEFQEAEKAYLKAIEVGKESPSPAAHFNLGVLYLKNLDRVDEAKAHLKRYLELVNAPAKDPAYGWLEEIEQRKAMEIQMKRMEEEAARQAEIDRKAEEEQRRLEEEAEKKAEGEPKAP